jgi:hypothetical protein
LLRRSWGPHPIEGGNYSGWLVLLTAAYLGIGIVAFAAWQISGNDRFVTDFFNIPGALVLVFLAAAQLWFSAQVLRHFGPGEAMRPVWLTITASAAFDLAGAICAQILANDSPVNPLRYTVWWSANSCDVIRSYGLLLGGTCRFTLLAIGLGLALRVYRRHGLFGRLRIPDFILLLGMATYVAVAIGEIAIYAGVSHPITMMEISRWPVDTLLFVLLAEALLLFRSAQRMESGWLGLCWKALAAGVFLISVGTASMWASRWAFIPWPWSAIFWYIWLPAATAMAVGPAYQLEAIQAAFNGAPMSQSRAAGPSRE